MRIESSGSPYSTGESTSTAALMGDLQRVADQRRLASSEPENLLSNMIKLVWSAGLERIGIPGQRPAPVDLQSPASFFGWLEGLVLVAGKPMSDFNIQVAAGRTALRFQNGSEVPLNVLASSLVQLHILDANMGSSLNIIGDGVMGPTGSEWRQARMFNVSARSAGVNIAVHDRGNTWFFSSTGNIGLNGKPWQRQQPPAR